MGEVASKLQAVVLTGSPLFVQAFAHLVPEHVGVTLSEVNALYGEGSVAGMQVRLHTVVTRFEQPLLDQWARNAGLGEVVGPRVAAHTSHVVVEVDQVTDWWGGQALMAQLLMLLARLAPQSVLFLPWQQATTTNELYLNDHESWDPQGGPAAVTWFSVLAAWADEARSSSLAVTRGLAAMGLPEVVLASSPRDPAQTRNLVRNVVGGMLARRVPVQAGVGIDIGTPMTLAPMDDPLTGDAALGLVPAGDAAASG